MVRWCRRIRGCKRTTGERETKKKVVATAILLMPGECHVCVALFCLKWIFQCLRWWSRWLILTQTRRRSPVNDEGWWGRALAWMGWIGALQRDLLFCEGFFCAFSCRCYGWLLFLLLWHVSLAGLTGLAFWFADGIGQTPVMLANSRVIWITVRVCFSRFDVNDARALLLLLCVCRLIEWRGCGCCWCT